MERRFSRLADQITRWAGSPFACLFAVVSILVWLVSGPVLHFSTAWQLYANTGTTIITYLIVFFLQFSSNRGNAALHAKLDILIAAKRSAPNDAIGAEERSEAEIRALKETAIQKVSEET